MSDLSPYYLDKKRINTWIDNTVFLKSYEGFDDLHIDEIFTPEPNQRDWFELSIKAYEYALKLIGEGYPDISCGLTFSLKAGDAKQGINFRDIQELINEFDITPPSLYLFKKGEELWNRPEAGCISPKNIQFLRSYIFYYSEFELQDIKDEFGRTLWCVKKSV